MNISVFESFLYMRSKLASIGTDIFEKRLRIGKWPVIIIISGVYQINLHVIWTLFILFGKIKVLLNNNYLNFYNLIFMYKVEKK